MRTIKSNIMYAARIIRRKIQMRSFYAYQVNRPSQYEKKASRAECRKIYEMICKEYVEIRVHLLRCDSIGESVPQYLIAMEDVKRNAAKGILDIFISEGNWIHNSRLLTIMRRNIHIVNKENIIIWRYVLSRFPKTEFRKYLYEYSYREKAGSINPENTAQYLTMEISEIEEVEYKKNEMGLKGVLVGVSSRDSAYLDTTSPEGEYTYHNYRDSNINFLNLSAEYLKTRGITMVRMGRFVKNKVQFDNCVDYANKYYDELMDIALMKEYKFYVGDSNGIVILPMALNIPCAFKNVVPSFLEAWGGHPQNSVNLFIFKKYYSRRDRRFLSIREMMRLEKKCGYFGQNYEEQQIEIVENTAEEILDLVKEMNERIDGTWIETEEDIKLRSQYRTIFNQWCEQEYYNAGAVIQANVGAAFLRKNRFLLD